MAPLSTFVATCMQLCEIVERTWCGESLEGELDLLSAQLVSELTRCEQGLSFETIKSVRQALTLALPKICARGPVLSKKLLLAAGDYLEVLEILDRKVLGLHLLDTTRLYWKVCTFQKFAHEGYSPSGSSEDLKVLGDRLHKAGLANGLELPISQSAFSRAMECMLWHLEKILDSHQGALCKCQHSFNRLQLSSRDSEETLKFKRKQRKVCYREIERFQRALPDSAVTEGTEFIAWGHNILRSGEIFTGVWVPHLGIVVGCVLAQLCHRWECFRSDDHANSMGVHSNIRITGLGKTGTAALLIPQLRILRLFSELASGQNVFSDSSRSNFSKYHDDLHKLSLIHGLNGRARGRARKLAEIYACFWVEICRSLRPHSPPVQNVQKET